MKNHRAFGKRWGANPNSNREGIGPGKSAEIIQRHAIFTIQSKRLAAATVLHDLRAFNQVSWFAPIRRVREFVLFGFVEADVRNCSSQRRFGWRFFKPRFECARSEEHTSELQSRLHLVCRL